MTDKRYSVIQAKFTRWVISQYNCTEFTTEEESNCHIKKLMNEPGCINDQFLIIDYGEPSSRHSSGKLIAFTQWNTGKIVK